MVFLLYLFDLTSDNLTSLRDVSSGFFICGGFSFRFTSGFRRVDGVYCDSAVCPYVAIGDTLMWPSLRLREVSQDQEFVVFLWSLGTK